MPSKKAAPSKRYTPPKDLEVTDLSEWKKDNSTILELPSGKVVKVKRAAGMKAFLKGGKIPNSLLPMVTEALGEDGKGTGNLDITQVLQNPESINDMFEMFDRVTVETMVQPRCYPVPEDEDDRQDDRLYVDEMDDGDKQFLLGYAMSGAKDLETFRKATSGTVAPVVAGD